MKNKIFLGVVLLVSTIAVVLSSYDLKKQSDLNQRIIELEEYVAKSKQEEESVNVETKEVHEEQKTEKIEKWDDEVKNKTAKVEIDFNKIQTERSGLWEYLNLRFGIDGNVYIPIEGTNYKFYTDIYCEKEMQEKPHIIGTNLVLVSITEARDLIIRSFLTQDGNVCYSNITYENPIFEILEEGTINEDYRKLFEEEPLKTSMEEFLIEEFRIDGNLYELEENTNIKFNTNTSCEEEVEKPVFLGDFYVALVNDKGSVYWALPLESGQIVFGKEVPLLYLKKKE